MLVQKQHKCEESTFPWWSDGIMAKMMMLITWTALHPVQWPGRIRSGWNFLNPETVRPVSDGGGGCGDGHDKEYFLAGICAFFLCGDENYAGGGKNNFLLQWKEINQENQGKYNQFPTNQSFLKEFSHLLWPHLQPLIDGSPQLQHESWITFCDYPKRLH